MTFIGCRFSGSGGTVATAGVVVDVFAVAADGAPEDEGVGDGCWEGAAGGRVSPQEKHASVRREAANKARWVKRMAGAMPRRDPKSNGEFVLAVHCGIAHDC